MALPVLLLLAVVQGVTEFLPVSSSGHLAMLEDLCGLSDPHDNLSLNVFLHFASVLAVILYYRRDLWALATNRRSLVLPLALATIPAGVIGLLFEKQIEAAFSSPVAVACGWIGTGAALTWGQRWARLDRDAEQLGIWRALGIGFAQAAAILPGLSRSGMTVSAALCAGLKADEATRFSLLMAIPVILGASALKLPKMFAAAEGISAGVVLAGALCFAVSWASLELLVRIVRARRLQTFAWYVWILAALVLGRELSG